jgi:hypothetical protein
MADVLSLGGISFNDFDYSPPEAMPAGGKQAMKVHKLPGGSRVIDTLGPDEDDIAWSGFFFGNDAYDNCVALDAMRAAGNVVALLFAGQYRDVIVNHFVYRIRRLPAWCEYEISCTVSQNPALGDLTANAPSSASVDNLVQQDLNSANATQDATIEDENAQDATTFSDNSELE